MSLDIRKLRHETEQELRDIGWTPSRKTSPWRWLGPLLTEGYLDNPAARDVLTEIGGLTVHARKAVGPNYPNAEMVFDPLLGGLGDLPRAAELATMVTAPLFPLGEWRNDMLVLISADGSIYATGPYGRWRVACSIEQFLNKIVCADEPVEFL